LKNPSLRPAILRIGKDEWSIEEAKGMLCYVNGPDGRQEDAPPDENFIFVDKSANRILICGFIDAWTLGEIVVGLMQSK
jgi:hypothetical protein